MKVTSSEPVLECTLEEFWIKFWSQEDLGCGESFDEATTVFRGESRINPKFRIPAADGSGNSDIFFDNRELLCRFANFPTPTQRRILNSIRRALADAKVNIIMITIPWSKTNVRKLCVRASGGNPNGPLDFELQ